VSKPEKAFDYDEPRFSHSGGLERRKVFVGGKVGTSEHTALREPDSLSRLHKRGVISHRQHDAADSWAKDYERAGMAQATIATYGGSVAVGSEPMPEARMNALQRFRNGLAAMSGRGAGIVWGVVIDNRTLSEWDQWPAPYVAERFREALDELAAFYGLPT